MLSVQTGHNKIAAKKGEKFVDDQPKLAWLRSSRCESNSCVEVAFSGQEVLVRDSKDPESPILSFPRPQWRDFIAAVHSGEFDRN